jgi:hypothetical protein
MIALLLLLGAKLTKNWLIEYLRSMAGNRTSTLQTGRSQRRTRPETQESDREFPTTDCGVLEAT